MMSKANNRQSLLSICRSLRYRSSASQSQKIKLALFGIFLNDGLMFSNAKVPILKKVCVISKDLCHGTTDVV